MNHREAIIKNQKLNKLFWLMRRCVTETEIEMKKRKLDEENKMREKKNKNNFKNKKNYASRKNNSED